MTKQDHAVLAPSAQVLYPQSARLAYSAKYTADAFAGYAFALNSKLDAHFNLSANYHSAQTVRLLATPDTLRARARTVGIQFEARY